MKHKIFSQNRAAAAVILGILCAVFASTAKFDASCEDLRQNVLRLHIIANSDSEEDQALKLKVRDAVLKQSDGIFDGNTDMKSAEAAVLAYLDEFCETANSVIRESGFDYTADVQLADSFFETREYEDFTLPAGTYRSLLIKLGKAEGKNWWCVVFPAVCVPAAADAQLSDSVNSESAAVAEHPQRYVMRFKAVEIYEDIKKFLIG